MSTREPGTSTPEPGTPEGRIPAGHTAEGHAATGAQEGTSGLEPFRRRLDFLDNEIARLLGERFEVVREVALHKREHDIPMMQPGRIVEVRERYMARGAEANMPPDFTAALFELLIGATCKLEDELIDTPTATAEAGER